MRSSRFGRGKCRVKLGVFVIRVEIPQIINNSNSVQFFVKYAIYMHFPHSKSQTRLYFSCFKSTNHTSNVCVLTSPQNNKFTSICYIYSVYQTANNDHIQILFLLPIFVAVLSTNMEFNRIKTQTHAIHLCIYTVITMSVTYS